MTAYVENLWVLFMHPRIASWTFWPEHFRDWTKVFSSMKFCLPVSQVSQSHMRSVAGRSYCRPQYKCSLCNCDCLQEFVWSYWVGPKFTGLWNGVRTAGRITEPRNYTSMNTSTSSAHVRPFHMSLGDVRMCRFFASWCYVLSVAYA